MKISTFCLVIWIVVAATAEAQGTTSGKAAGPGATSAGPLPEIRALVHELQGRTDKLGELMTLYRSHMERRPQSGGGSPEAKKAQDEQNAKWSAALDRLLLRIDQARAAVVETTQRLDQTVTGELPTSLGKDLANARNEAGAERTAAEQALAKNKGSAGRKSKPAKPAPPTEKTPPLSPDDLDL